MAKKRDLTPEEKRLWRYVTRNDEKLHDEGAEEELPPEDIKKPAAKPAAKRPDPLPPKKDPPRLPKLALGSYAGVDTRTTEKFRKGKYPIDARLDLHGFSRPEAQAALEAFLQSQYDKGSRCLLVITGKGRGGAKGILRDALPAWIVEFRQLVLAFDVAKAKHGGEGAYYVLLKRKR